MVLASVTADFLQSLEVDIDLVAQQDGVPAGIDCGRRYQTDAPDGSPEIGHCSPMFRERPQPIGHKLATASPALNRKKGRHSLRLHREWNRRVIDTELEEAKQLHGHRLTGW